MNHLMNHAHSRAQIFRHGLGPRADVQFLEDAFDVSVDGPVGDLQFLGDFFVKIAFGQEIKDLLLASGKVCGFGGGRGLLEGVHHFALQNCWRLRGYNLRNPGR